MSETLRIAGMTVRKASTARGSVELMELPDGSRVSLPVVVVNGASPGPRLYLGAGLHGDEASGVRIVSQCVTQLNPERLSGSVVCVPVQNPLAFQSDHRISVAHYLRSPLDQAPNDPWACFPGDPGGNSTEVLVWRLFQLIRACQYAIDVHTPTRGGRYLPITFLPPATAGDGARRAEELAHAFGSGCIVKTGQGMYVRDGVLSVEATRAGIPSIMFEVGEGGRLEPDAVAVGVRCVLNALRFLGMVPGCVEKPAGAVVIRDLVGVRATRGGLLSTEVALGARVREGDVLARVWSIYGEELEAVRAPAGGVFVRATTLSTVATGDRVATIGVE